MDSATAVTILSAHLILSGALFGLIARSMSADQGLSDWSVGSVCYGLAFAGRLLTGADAATPASLLVDAAMLAGVLSFFRGLSVFAGQPLSRRRVLAVTAALAACDAAVALLAGSGPRLVTLNATLGVIYAGTASLAWRTAATPGHSQSTLGVRAPLRLLAGMFGVVAAMTLGRAVQLLGAGAPGYHGRFGGMLFVVGSLAVVLIQSTLLWMIFARISGRLTDLAARDPLTQALNRHGLQNALDRVFSAQPGVDVVLLQVDVDHFKSVNDRHGHAMGDRLLETIAVAIRDACRREDLVSRTGGEEFVVACVGAPLSVAGELAERIRSRIAALALRTDTGDALGCSVSIGLSHPFTDLQHCDRAMRQADRALYRAKAMGRNLCVRYDVELAEPAV